ncbi:zinc ribbon domain-containing protein [Candidatus Bathyarchaeota archaeon]|nr:zinc ribbon domain-containing protein [Candidatus Bathyarchaeota archaeon]
MSNEEVLRLNLNKAREIAVILHNQYQDGGKPFEKFRLPDYTPPPGMNTQSKEHALYLTYIFVLEKWADRELLWKSAAELYTGSPWFFDAEHILTRSYEGLREALTRLGVSDIDGAVKRWRETSKFLIENYSGDPKSLSKVPEEALRTAVKKVIGTSEEMHVNRYLQLMTVNKLLKTKNLKIGITVDRNVVIYTMYTGVLRLCNRQGEVFTDRDPVLSLTRKAWNEGAAAVNAPPWELDELIHIVSSRLCPNRRCLLCPVYKVCERLFNLKIYRNRIRGIGSETAEPPTAGFCIRCGRDLRGDSRFCDGCGLEIPMEE